MIDDLACAGVEVALGGARARRPDVDDGVVGDGQALLAQQRLGVVLLQLQGARCLPAVEAGPGARLYPPARTARRARLAATLLGVSYAVTLIPGDGIGPELADAAVTVLAATGVDIDWHRVDAGEAQLAKYGTPLPEHVLDAIRETRVALKGPITTPIGEGFRSVNVTLRQALDLYANLRPARSIHGVESRYEDVDLVIVRENTEDLYAGIEHMVGRDAAESIKIITRAASERIARFAFDYAVANGRHKVTAVHKANIMKLSDGLFLESCRTVADGVRRPRSSSRTASSTTCACSSSRSRSCTTCWCCPTCTATSSATCAAGLVGGLGVAPGANIGTNAAVFEPVHGSAPKYAGQDRANPTALILSAALMLRHLGEVEAGERVERAVRDVIGAGRDGAARPWRRGRHEGICPRRRRRRRQRAAGRRQLTAPNAGDAGQRHEQAAALLRYRGREGMVAWAFHRISGVGIFAFVVLHVVDIYLVGGNPQLYDEVLAFYASIPGRLLEVVLGAALLYHALNGLRIVIIDLWPRDDRLPPRSCGGGRGSSSSSSACPAR